MEFPKDLRYTKSHEWVRKTDSGVVVGITAFAVEQLGDITLVELPEVGKTFAAAADFGTIESVKSVSDLYAPLAGDVTRVNEDLDDSPELVNEDCYKTGWLVEMKPANDADVDALLDADAYAKLVAEAQ
ncbi:MAG: glycine cleavage system protein H [Proteobacteria bacterium]|nr:MAG: glycine cleavage system protein H [Pseudomonadota bacterium]